MAAPQKKPNKVNLHCPVPGCKTKAPHLNDLTVQGLVRNFSDPATVAGWTRAAIGELANSMSDDLSRARHFALFTRTRQIEELYIRALYAMLMATPEEIAHIMSDERPNGFREMYKKVNDAIFEGRGILEVSQPGLKHGTFTAMDTINRGAHVSFSTMLTVVGLARNPQYMEPYTSGRYFAHLSVYCTYLDHARKLFEAGRDKTTVQTALINMHRPKSYWEAQAKAEARANQPTTGAEQNDPTKKHTP